MDVWTAHSRPGIQRAACAATIGVGVLLIWAAGRQETPAAAARWLGVVLVALGVLGVLFSGRQTITIDPSTRTITTTDNTPSGQRVRTVRFDEVDEVRVGRLGSATSGIPFFFLQLRLRDGERCNLFAPGRWYPGAMSRSRAHERRQKLDRYLRGAAA